VQSSRQPFAVEGLYRVAYHGDEKAVACLHRFRRPIKEAVVAIYVIVAGELQADPGDVGGPLRSVLGGHHPVVLIDRWVQVGRIPTLTLVEVVLAIVGQ
jgi:hypothetical protein